MHGRPSHSVVGIMAKALKGTLFQGIAKLDSNYNNNTLANNINFWESKCNMFNASLVSEVYAAPCGKMGDSELLSDILGHVDMNNVGSFHLKIKVNERLCSIIVFNNGSVKISGATGSYIEDKEIDSFMNTVCNILCVWTKSSLFQEPKLLCINGQFKIPQLTTQQLRQLVQELKPKFAKVKEPAYDVPGRRGAYKMYYYNDRKFHVAIDTGGNCQIFAAQSFRELRQIYRQFYC